MTEAWPNFLEKIVDVLGLVLTDAETERVLRSLPRSPLSLLLHNKSHENMLKLAREAETQQRLCKHPGSCSSNCIRGGVRAFVGAYLVKFLIALLPLLLSGRIFKNPRLLQQCGGKDTVRFGVFLAAFVSSFKGINCFLRAYRQKEDMANAFIAGMVAGLTLLLDEKSRRISIALYLSTRALEFVYVFLMRRGVVPQVPHGDAIVMALASSQILFAFLREPQSLAKSYYVFLLRHGGIDKHGEGHREYLKDVGLLTASTDMPVGTRHSHIFEKYHYPLTPSQLDQASIQTKLHVMSHPTSEYCTVGNTQFFLESIPRSLALYVPLNVAMGLIFRNKVLLKRPQEFLLKTAISSLRSSLFLSLYCTVAWAVPCTIRNILHEDYTWMYYVNGIFSGMCVLLEVKSRRLELAMYCAPRALESLWNCLVSWGYTKNIKNGEALYFSLAMGALLSIYQNEPENLNSSYRSVLTRFLGVN